MKKLIIAFTTIALSVAASAATKYNVTLFQPSVINGTELKAGDYRVAVEDGKAVFTQGKKTFEAPVKVEDTTDKVSSNTVRYVEGTKVQEIRIGGTHTKLVFAGSGNADTSAGAR
jgi:Ethanolamine utilization protein EutJ (predicted chaperonin)